WRRPHRSDRSRVVRSPRRGRRVGSGARRAPPCPGRSERIRGAMTVALASGGSELLEESNVALDEHAHVWDRVLQDRHALDPESEGEPRVLFAVVAADLEVRWLAYP